jgi:hypothetical protein
MADSAGKRREEREGMKVRKVEERGREERGNKRRWERR